MTNAENTSTQAEVQLEPSFELELVHVEEQIALDCYDLTSDDRATSSYPIY